MINEVSQFAYNIHKWQYVAIQRRRIYSQIKLYFSGLVFHLAIFPFLGLGLQ